MKQTPTLELTGTSSKHISRKWLQNLLREIGEPDHWQQLVLELSKTKIGFEKNDAANTFFNIKEYDLLAANLDLAAEKLADSGLDEEQIEHIRLKFNHLKDMGRKIGRSDWESLFVGTMVSAMTQMGVNPETAQVVWRMLQEVFGKLFTGVRFLQNATFCS